MRAKAAGEVRQAAALLHGKNGKTEDGMTQGLQKETADGAVRLNKYISDAGVCSRREADRLIETGK